MDACINAFLFEYMHKCIFIWMHVRMQFYLLCINACVFVCPNAYLFWFAKIGVCLNIPAIKKNQEVNLYVLNLLLKTQLINLTAEEGTKTKLLCFRGMGSLANFLHNVFIHLFEFIGPGGVVGKTLIETGGIDVEFC